MLDELRYQHPKLKHVKTRDARICNNRMFQEDQSMFYRKTQGQKQMKGKVPEIEKFEEFWAGIWEDGTQTPYRKWMKTVAKEIAEKVTDVHVLVIDEKKLCEIVRKRKNWSAPGIDGIQNFWWKKLKGALNSIIRCFNQWIEHPEEIPTWIMQERTVLLP